ncbi:MAG TPA: hypothetical protein VLC09_12430 [Polyangiaceae bacterium]|nr:hypothetical protein [Polyangiaceae bacterium]
MRARATLSVAPLWGAMVRALGILATAATLLGSTDAVAQTTPPTNTNTSVTLVSSGFIVQRVPERTSGQYPYWLNRKDCLDDDLSLPEVSEGDPKDPNDPYGGRRRAQIQITPTLRGFNTTMNLEVWVSVGANCTDQAERREATGRCWRVFSQAPTQSGQTITIRPKQVIAEKPATGAAADFWDTPETCNKGTDRRNITFYVMLIKGGTTGDVVGTSATWEKTNIDIATAPPPTLDEVAAGDMRLFPGWSVATGNDLEDTQGFRFYCEAVGADGGGQVGGPGGATGGGLGGEGGQSSGAVGCPSQPALLQQGMVIDEVKAQRCGYVTGRSARSGQAVYFMDENDQPTTPLENGTTYAIGVTTNDLVFNESRLSGLLCGTPREVTSFFEGYRGAGGVGGGGFCGYAPSRANAGWFAAIALAGGWLVRRAAHRRRHSA